MLLRKILNKKVIAIRGFNSKGKTVGKRTKISAQYILFDDRKTFIELETQDSYTYHDCSRYARDIKVCIDKKRWEDIYNDRKYFPNATVDID